MFRLAVLGGGVFNNIWDETDRSLNVNLRGVRVSSSKGMREASVRDGGGDGGRDHSGGGVKIRRGEEKTRQLLLQLIQVMVLKLDSEVLEL
jgi:hypothetical protein